MNAAVGFAPLQHFPAIALLSLLLVGGCVGGVSAADVAKVTIEAQQPEVWIGQRATFFVELRASGSFGGAASFSIPQIPRTVIVKVGSPVVSSKDIEGESWFVQTHEFALFSQQAGTLQLPPFEVRHGSRDGFTGPVHEQVETVPSLELNIKRPPGEAPPGLLVTTEQIDIQETWEPTPGAARVGDVYRRTITQSADQMTGMALAPPPSADTDSIGVYPGRPRVSDDMQRGAFRGTRVDTLTYQLRQSGTQTLPAIQYVWWNPQTETYGSHTLPAVTFEVAAPPAPSADAAAARQSPWWMLAMGVLGGGWLAVVYWQRHRIARGLRSAWQRLHPPQRAAARSLLRACRHHNAAEAVVAWQRWQTLRESRVPISPDLHEAIQELMRQRYGSPPVGTWQGRDLLAAFQQQLASEALPRRSAAGLPELNP